MTSHRARGPIGAAARQIRKADPPDRQAGLRPKFGSRVRDDDILIPPRKPGEPSHEIVETATEYLVRVIFPGVLSLADLRWELTGDVLEVEYEAPGLHYFEDFLIPAPSAPRVRVHDRVFVAKFSKTA
jgi:hypothetical protein